MATRGRYLVALLFNADVAAEINGVRRALGSSQISRIPPHITLIPPLNLLTDAAHDPEELVRDVVGTLEPFQLHLGAADTFPDNPGVLFFAVDQSAELSRLRGRLHEAIPGAADRDHRAFIPHVTLISRRDDHPLASLAVELSHYSRATRIEGVSLMTQVEDAPERPWRLVATYDLGAAAVVGRGGVEITMHGGRGRSDALAAALERWGRPAVDSFSEQAAKSRFVLASIGGIIVGVAVWNERVGAADLAELVVAPESRGLGIGTRLVSFVEAQARDKDASLLCAYVDPQSEIAQFLSGRGFCSLGEIAFIDDERRGFAHHLT